MKPNPDVTVAFNDYDVKAMIAEYVKANYPNMEVGTFDGLPTKVTVSLINKVSLPTYSGGHR